MHAELRHCTLDRLQDVLSRLRLPAPLDADSSNASDSELGEPPSQADGEEMNQLPSLTGIGGLPRPPAFARRQDYAVRFCTPSLTPSHSHDEPRSTHAP
jgi:hypothetical protein